MIDLEKYAATADKYGDLAEKYATLVDDYETLLHRWKAQQAALRGTVQALEALRATWTAEDARAGHTARSDGLYEFRGRKPQNAGEMA